METADHQHPPQQRPPLPAAPASDDRYARLLENLQIGVVIQERDARVAFANRAALEMLGLDAAEVVGHGSLAVGELAVHPDGTPFPPEDHPGPRALATGRPVRGVMMGFYHRALEDRVWLLVNADPEPEPSGGVARVVCTFVDVTPFKNAEQRLQHSEARYRQLVEKAQDIIYGTDPEGFFTYVNPAASQLMGYPAHELVGRHFTSLVREDHRQRVAERLVLQFQERTHATYDEFPVLPRDGHELWIGQNVQLIVKDGRVEGFQAVARDITERKRAQLALERERRQLRDIVSHAPVAMAILDRDLRYVAHSRKWAKLWGVEGEAIVGRSHAEVSPRLLGRYADAIQRALAGQVVTNPEDAVQLADGSTLYTRWTIHPWLDTDGVAGVVTVVQNVDLLVRARQAAQEASRHKSEFLANISHELRTPLGQMITVSALLQQTSLDEQQGQWVQHVRDAGGELLDRIDGILHFARLEAEPLDLKLEEFSPRDLSEAVARAFEGPAAAKGLAFSWEPGPGLPGRVRGDEARLRQALHQLVSNAVKFTAEGSVRLRLRASGASEEPVLTFEVEDTGPGIAPEEQARLFQPFTQLDGSASRRHGGAGLGLALAHRLAQAMGGELTLSSKPGRGSTFVFRARFERVETALDEERPAAPGPTAAAAAIGAPETPRVLVAEDNPINRKVVMAMLDKLGYRGDAVGNGLEAVEACARTRYDLVLMDGMMPEMDGYRATAWIRQREGPGRRTPIVALTASTAPGDREKCFAAGMDGYLSKPISLRMLEETLRRWVPAPEDGAGRAPASADTSGSRLPADHPLRVLEARGRREAVVEIIDLFLESTPLRLDRLREMARDGDLAALLSLAHSLRGAALQLGAREVAALCADVQAAAREGQPERLDPLFERLQAEVRAVSELLGGERARLVGTSGDA